MLQLRNRRRSAIGAEAGGCTPSEQASGGGWGQSDVTEEACSLSIAIYGSDRRSRTVTGTLGSLMDALRIKRRRIAGARGPISAFTPGSSQRALSRPIPPPAQTPNQSRPSRHSRVDSVESDAEDDYEHAGIDLPDQLPSLPEDHRGDDSMEARDLEEVSPQPLSRSERLREILKFRGLAQRYGEEDGQTSTQHTSQSNLRLAQAIHAYAIEYYLSRGMLPADKMEEGKDASLRRTSSKTRRTQASVDRGRDVIPPHLIKKPAKKVHAPTLSHADAPVPYEILSDSADSDYVASDNEEGDDEGEEAEEMEEEEVRVESPEARRTKDRSKKVEAAARKPPESVQDAFDETALFAICECGVVEQSARNA